MSSVCTCCWAVAREAAVVCASLRCLNVLLECIRDLRIKGHKQVIDSMFRVGAVERMCRWVALQSSSLCLLASPAPVLYRA